MGDTVLVPHVYSKIIRPLDSARSNPGTPFNWTIHAVVVVLCAVVPVEGLFRLKGSWPGAIRGFAGKSSWGASMRTTTDVVDTC